MPGCRKKNYTKTTKKTTGETTLHHHLTPLSRGLEQDLVICILDVGAILGLLRTH